MKFGRVFSQSFRLFGKNALVLCLGGLLLLVANLVVQSGPQLLLGVSPTDPSSASQSAQTQASIIGAVLSLLISLPLTAGLVNVNLQFGLTGYRSGVGDLFAGYRQLGSLVVFGLIAYIVTFLAAIFVVVLVLMVSVVMAFFNSPIGFLLLLPLSLAPYVYIAVNWAYVLPIIFERQQGAMDAISESRLQIRRNGFWPTLVVGLCALLLGVAVMVVTLGIASIVVLPWLTSVVVAMYLQASDRSFQLEEYIGGRPHLAAPAPPAWERPPWAAGAEAQQAPADPDAVSQYDLLTGAPPPETYTKEPATTAYGTPLPEDYRKKIEEEAAAPPPPPPPEPVKVDPAPPWEQEVKVEAPPPWEQEPPQG